MSRYVWRICDIDEKGTRDIHERLLSPTIPLNPDRKYVNKFTRGSGRAGCPHSVFPVEKVF